MLSATLCVAIAAGARVVLRVGEHHRLAGRAALRARRTASPAACSSSAKSFSASATIPRSFATAALVSVSFKPYPNTDMPHSSKSAIGKPGVNESMQPLVSSSFPSSV